MIGCYPIEPKDQGADAGTRYLTLDYDESRGFMLEVGEPSAAIDDSVSADAAMGSTFDVRVSSATDEETSEEDCLIVTSEIAKTVKVALYVVLLSWWTA